VATRIAPAEATSDDTRADINMKFLPSSFRRRRVEGGEGREGISYARNYPESRWQSGNHFLSRSPLFYHLGAAAGEFTGRDDVIKFASWNLNEHSASVARVKMRNAPCIRAYSPHCRLSRRHQTEHRMRVTFYLRFLKIHLSLFLSLSLPLSLSTVCRAVRMR